MSDLSQVFEVHDILVLSEAITALSGGDSKKKMGILSSAPSSGFLCHTAIFGRFKTFQFQIKSLVRQDISSLIVSCNFDQCIKPAELMM